MKKSRELQVGTIQKIQKTQTGTNLWVWGPDGGGGWSRGFFWRASVVAARRLLLADRASMEELRDRHFRVERRHLGRMRLMFWAWP